jgi:acyl carrier protein
VSDRGLLAEITQMLIEVTGEDAAWGAAITETTELEADLRLDSLETLALAQRLRERYGEAVDLPAYCADLELDQLVGLSVGDVVSYVARREPRP